jgi:hypothetical protein
MLKRNVGGEKTPGDRPGNPPSEGNRG